MSVREFSRQCSMRVFFSVRSVPTEGRVEKTQLSCLPSQAVYGERQTIDACIARQMHAFFSTHCSFGLRRCW